MRLAGRLVAGVVLVVGVLVSLHGPARRLRREVLVERAVEALGDAVDAHLARTGRCPGASMLSGGELARLLVDAGDLAAIPRNPDTGEVFGTVALETDLVFYEPVQDGRGFRLEVLDERGLDVVAVRVGPRR